MRGKSSSIMVHYECWNETSDSITEVDFSFLPLVRSSLSAGQPSALYVQAERRMCYSANLPSQWEGGLYHTGSVGDPSCQTPFSYPRDPISPGAGVPRRLPTCPPPEATPSLTILSLTHMGPGGSGRECPTEAFFAQPLRNVRYFW